MACPYNADYAIWFSRAIGGHSRGSGFKKQPLQGRPRSGFMLVNLGVGQYVPNQGKECKPPVCYNSDEIGHFKGGCPKKAKGTR